MKIVACIRNTIPTLENCLSAPTVKESSGSSTALDAGKLAELFTRLESLYAAGDVKRCHTVQTLRTYTIAEHVYGSMLIARELVALNQNHAAAEYGLSISLKDVLEALLLHDAPEYATGDIPAPVKRADDAISKALDRLEAKYYAHHAITVPQLNPVERDIVRVSDTLDLGMFLLRERRLGNRNPHLTTILKNVLAYTYEQRHLVGVNEFRSYLHHEFRNLIAR